MQTTVDSRKIRNPFPGLRPFETDEYRLFFGREGQSDNLITRLERTRFLAIVGTSGSGKSSLVRAGLLPALHGGLMAGAGSGWRISIMRPGSDPIGNLAAALADKDVLLDAGGNLGVAEAEAMIEATLRSGSLGLVEAARRARLGEHEKLLVVVDQFEELFRFRSARAQSSTGDDAAAFVKLLLEAAQQREIQIYVVPTMRSDFLGDCAQFQGLPEAINDGQYLIPRMTRDERRFAISGPVGVTRGKISEPLINRLMNDVGDNPDQLPILQHALMRTWDYWAQHRRNGEPIGLEHYEAVGTMADALSRHADEAFYELPDDRSRTIAEKLFKALTEQGAGNRETRRPLPLHQLCTIAGASEAETVLVINTFRQESRSFLMPTAGTPLLPDTIIDISHESLIRNWERLKTWVNEEAQSARVYRRLAEAAILHERGEEGLLSGPFLQIALDWRAQNEPNRVWAYRYNPEFETASRFLDASRQNRDEQVAAQEREQQERIARERRELEQAQLYADQQRRAARRLRWLVTGMAVMFVLAIFTAGYAVTAKRKTEAQRQELALTLLQKQKAENERFRSDMARAEAEQSRQEANEAREIALQKAVEEEEHAKTEAKRANVEAANAKRNAADALNAAQAAATAKTTAEVNAQQVIKALERGELIRSGLESFRRGNVDDAKAAFQALKDKLEKLQPGSPDSYGLSYTKEQSQQFVNDYGWTLSHLGDTYHASGDNESSIETYEQARQILEGISNTPKKRPILFETYHGLAHAYHDNAVMRSDPANTQLPATRLKLTPDEQFKKAEEYYNKALDYLKDTSGGDPLVAVAGYKNLARLYIDTGKYKEAEENLKLVVDAYKTVEYRPGAKTIEGLKELAEFYRSQDRNEEAAETYNELIGLQEGGADATGGLLALSDNYGELGQIYKALNQEQRAETIFELAEKLQQLAVKVKHRGDSVIKPDASNITYDFDLEQIGDLYVKLDRAPEAVRSYQEAIMIRKEVTAKNNLLPASYLKLAELYDEKYPDKSKAEEYYKLVIAASPAGDDGPGKYVRALRRLGALYAGDLGQPELAAPLYNRALTTLDTMHPRLAWQEQFAVFSSLLSLYRQTGKSRELEQTYSRFLETLHKQRGSFISASYRSDDYPPFMASYLKALAEITNYYLEQKDVARAKAAYGPAFATSAPPFIERTNDPVQLEDLAVALEKVRARLSELNLFEDAAKFHKLIIDARSRRTELLSIIK